LGHSVSHFARRTFLAGLCSAGSASALGRTPNFGTLRLRLPLYFGGLDPHALDDPLSALFASAIADPLFALDAVGKPYPTLASALPERTPQGARIRLRPELLSARGKAISSADVVFSLKRAQSSGGAAVLGAFRSASVDSNDARSLLIPNADPDDLARALASPLTAIVPRGFSPTAPDGTGAFKAKLNLAAGTLTLTRNDNAARSAAFLDSIELSRAADLADALRAFEAGQVDVGWLGGGLYRQRARALPLEGPIFGWIVLRTGLDAKSWGAPGVAPQITAALPASALTRFGLRAVPGAGVGVRWAGGRSPLLVSDDAPYLVELARALEPLLSSPGNDLRTTPLARAAWQKARATQRFGLLLDFVRAANSDGTQSALTLLAAADPALTKRPPKTFASLHDVTRTLTLGIVGELYVSGSRSPEFQGLNSWQLGSVWLDAEQR
jgi:peptide/nickel transport system substrate-binding protein